MSNDKVSLLGESTPAPCCSETRSYNTAGGSHEVPELRVQTGPRRLPQHIAALSATLSALAAGMVLGWTSPILNEMEHGKYNNITVNDEQMGWVGSFATLGAMIMCIPAGFLCDLIGRRTTLIYIMLPFTVGWSLILFAESVILLYFGRLVTGMAVGASCVAAPLYTAEIAQKEIRGSLGSYFQLMITIGIFLAYLFGKFLSPVLYTCVCSTCPSIFFLFFVFQPESPVFCLRKGWYDMALQSLTKLRGPHYDVQAELNEIEGAVKENLELAASLKDTIKKKSTRKALLVAFALMFFQQFSGINCIIVYTSDIFTAAGVKLDANTASIFVGAFQALATLCSSLLIDRLGRKILLFISALVMSLSTLMLALYFTLKNRSGLDAATLNDIGFLPVVSLCLFVVVFSVGLGPIPWMISSEIFTPEIKSVASSAAGTFNWFLAFIVTKFYLQASHLVGEDSTFYFFAVMSSLCFVFVYFVVPETKGKTVEQIQVELEE